MNQSTFAILDGLRPFTQYLSGAQPIETEIVLPKTRISTTNTRRSRSEDMISDWGIEMDTTNSPTLVNIDQHSSHINTTHTGSGGFVHFDDDSTVGADSPVHTDYNNFNLTIPKRSHVSIELLLNNILVTFYDVDCRFQKFGDEFKYILITSQLLDETILVSKYKKKISTLQLKHKTNTIMTNFGNILTGVRTQYIMSGDYLHSMAYIEIIHFVRYLTNNYTRFSEAQLKSILIIITVNLYSLANYKSINMRIIEHSILNNLKRFIKNYQKLDITTIKLLNKIKELTFFPNLLHSTSKSNNLFDSELSEKIYDVLQSSIALSINCITNRIADLVPLINGSALENYCEVYNVHLEELNYCLTNDYSKALSNYEKIAQRLKKFQYLRRFLICCLLSTNELPESSTFLRKLTKLFHSSTSKSLVVTTFNRLSWVSKSLQIMYELSEILNANMIDFIKANMISTAVRNEDSNVSITGKDNDISTQLSAKLKEVQLSLATLDKRESISTQINEFTKIGELLFSAQQIYSQDLVNLQNSSQVKPFNLGPNSLSNRIILSKRKRFSLPPQQLSIPSTRTSPRSTSLQSPLTPSSAVSNGTSTPKNYKRLSTGLSIPLLTVMETETDINDNGGMRKVSYDDNYINITPSLRSPAYLEGAEPEQDYISEKNLLSNDDTVMMNFNPKEDGNDEGDTSGPIDAEEFKRTLERNFNRVLSTSTVIGHEVNHDNLGQDVNYNDSKVDAFDGALLMNELSSRIGGLNV